MCVCDVWNQSSAQCELTFLILNHEHIDYQSQFCRSKNYKTYNTKNCIMQKELQIEISTIRLVIFFNLR